MKKILFFVSTMIASITVYGQDLKTIQEIQAPIDLNTCRDSSVLAGQSVKVRGVVMMAPNLTWQNATGRHMFIQTGNGPYGGLQIRQNLATTNTGIGNLLPGDSVEIIGVVQEFSGNTQFNPDVDQPMDDVLGSGSITPAQFNDLSQFNNNDRRNKFLTGEQWENQFVEILGPLTVTFVDIFSSGTRCSFDVVDAAGNKMNVTDLFACQRLATNGGTFVAPTVGDVYNKLSGIILHSRNDDPSLGCGGPTSGRGYSLAPFSDSHYDRGAAAPSVVFTSRSPITPTTSQNTTITATITDDGSVASAKLKYAVGVSNNTYIEVDPTSVSGSTYTFTIPNTAYSEGSFVKYYITATDNISLVANVPNVPNNQFPMAFRVRDNGTQINDVQYTPFNNGNSIYKDLEVTVEGVVIASAQSGDLGYVYIQQEGLIEWAGLSVVGSTSLQTLSRGQKVRVTGVIRENFFETRMQEVSQVTVIGSGTITPLSLSPNTFTTYSFADNEKYEGMLINLRNSTTSQKIYVVDANADGADLTTNNFAEYRVGMDEFDPNAGCRILAGRVNTSTFSSLNVSYVNDPSWATVAGTMNVAVLQVTEGTRFDSIAGIITYTFSNMKLLPRNNNDFYNVSYLLNAKSVVEKNNAEIVMYPNPATQSITFNGIENNAIVTIYNALGSEIATKSLNNLDATIALDNMSNGTYLVKVSSEKGLLYQNKLTVIK
jgi:hypothetical protein